MRLFVSVDLPARLAEPLERIQDDLAADGLRLTDPTQAHLTLKFLGETNPDRIDGTEQAIQRAVETAGVESFDCTVGGLGVFPSLDYISVVWAGVRDEGGAAELTRLHDAVETELTAMRFEPESHAFTPHVTLGRMDDARGKSQVQQIVTETDPTIGTFRVEKVRLTESRLTETGPQYETVSEVEL